MEYWHRTALRKTKRTQCQFAIIDWTGLQKGFNSSFPELPN